MRHVHVDSALAKLRPLKRIRDVDRGCGGQKIGGFAGQKQTKRPGGFFTIQQKPVAGHEIRNEGGKKGGLHFG